MIYALTFWDTHHYEPITGLIVDPHIWKWEEDINVNFVYQDDVVHGIGSVIVITEPQDINLI